MSELRLEGVSKAYGPQPVLEHLDLTVADGSITALLGPSGSGKTTLLRLVAGFDSVDGGVVRIGGDVVDDGHRRLPPERRRLGYVPQDGGLFPHLTVAGNVGFGLPRAERRGPRVADLLAMVGLAGLSRRYPDQLSGGQQQRVALARALAVDPQLVLLDEPFSALDPTLRATIRAEVLAILRVAGATAILVTHDQDEALSSADDVAVIHGGVVVQHGPPHELYASPSTSGLARFLGVGNFFSTTVADGSADTPLGAVPVTGTVTGEATVLVRPEQVRADTAGTTGVAGRVVRSEFHGHSTLLGIILDAVPDGPEISSVDRSATPPPVGARVRVTLTGPAMAWPGADDEPPW